MELLFPHSHMQLLWSSLYDFFWRWIVVWGRIKHWKLFWSESELGWRWLNDEVIQAVIVKTIRRMPKCTFKMQFQDTFAWMICLNSLFFLGERQPTVMKYVWEKLFWFEQRTSYQQHPGRKFLAADRRGINTKMKLLWFSLYDFLPATSGRKVSGGGSKRK